MIYIVVEKSFTYSTNYKHKYLYNINKLYKYAGKCDDQYQYKDIIESAMISSSESIANNNTMEVSAQLITKKPCVSK